jgi:putative Mg2+ transporter-C (MgtC) family protein
MDPWISQLEALMPLETLVRLLVAMAAGAVIGWEREKRDKPAGLRTHMLVALGAAVFIIGALELPASIGDDNSAIRLDPMRALAAIIGGVGFLGAGTIIEARGSVRGITTAASIWITAAIGTSCGMGLYRLALSGGVLAVVVLWCIGFLEHAILKTKESHDSPSSG